MGGLADEEEVRSVWLQADETLGHGLLRLLGGRESVRHDHSVRRLLRDGACDEQPARDSLPRLFPDARWAGLGFGGVLRSHESLCPQSRWHLQRRPVCSICLPRPDLGTVHCLVWRGMFPLRLRMCIERVPVVPRPDGARHVLALRADGRGYQLRNRPVHEAGTARVRVCACRCRRQCGCGLCRLRILQAGVERRSYLGTGCHAHAVQAPRLVCDCDSPHEPALLLAKIRGHVLRTLYSGRATGLCPPSTSRVLFWRQTVTINACRVSIFSWFCRRVIRTLAKSNSSTKK